MARKLPSCVVLGIVGDEVLLRVTRAATAQSVLSELLCSKATARAVLAGRQAVCGGRTLSGASELRPGDELVLRLARAEEPRPPRAGSLEVVYQDRVLLAADKPAGLLVHGDGTGAPTLTALVQGWLAERDLAVPVQAVQRLDVETTGLTLFALGREFQPVLDAQVAGHGMRKRYLAEIDGRLHGASAGWVELRWPIGRDRHDARRMRAGGSGKPALTRVRTLDVRDGRSLLLVELGTGRRHQIRVHLARAGHPLVGDALYGGRANPEGLMLHAWQEELDHPITGERLRLATAWPVRFGARYKEVAIPSEG